MNKLSRFQADPHEEDRPPIPRKMRAEAMKKNRGICMAPKGCKRKGVICEHVQPWYFVREHKFENLEPYCKPCADEKTVKDKADIAHCRHLRLESGQQKLLLERKAAGEGSRIQSQPMRAGANSLKAPPGYKYRWGKRKIETRPR